MYLSDWNETSKRAEEKVVSHMLKKAVAVLLVPAILNAEAIACTAICVGSDPTADGIAVFARPGRSAIRLWKSAGERRRTFCPSLGRQNRASFRRISLAGQPGLRHGCPPKTMPR